MAHDPESLSTRNDAELTLAVRESADAEALAELYTRHRPAVLAYARTCCRDRPHLAEDLVSEAFARTMETVRGGGGPETEWRPYLIVVVRNIAIAWGLAARRTELSDDIDRRLGHLRDILIQESGEDTVLRQVEQDMTLRGYRTLPGRWQTVLWHTVVEELPTDRAGSLMGLSASGVSSLAARAREALREAYLAAHAHEAAGEACRHYAPLIAAMVRSPTRRSGGNRDLSRHLSDCRMCRGVLRHLTYINSQLPC
ncbi:RNA polymerase sigma factor [Streptomyces sp. NPDC058989]|uniref:RNA polymerase sigma factor n=1 Tax=Streptomyces sp. NPDC058989 TaxID=3346686 RepID=UPI003679DEE6